MPENQKFVKHVSGSDTKCSWCAWNGPEIFERGLEGEIRGRIETIQNVVLLRSAKIFRKFLKNWEDLLSLRFHWTISALAGRKKRNNRNNINNSLPTDYNISVKQYFKISKCKELKKKKMKKGGMLRLP